MTTLVRSRLVTPDQRPVAGRRVMARLSASSAWLADHTGEVIDCATVHTDPNGYWQVDLTPQSQIATASYYTFVISGTADVYAIVPDQGPVELASILIDRDEVEPDPGRVLMRSELGEPGGVAPLDDNGLVPREHLPEDQGATALAGLSDVDVAAAANGQVLAFHDGKWIATSTGDLSGTHWWAAAGPPVTSALPGAKVGDFYIDTTTGNVYTLDVG